MLKPIDDLVARLTSHVLPRPGTTFTQFGDEWRGALDVPYNHIVEVFGPPTINGYDHRTDAQWYIETPDGEVRLYNYKNGRTYLGPKGPATQDITRWLFSTNDVNTVLWVKLQLG